MTDLTTPMYEDMDDVELIVTYLQGRLPAERAEAVKRRLKEDPAFLEFAAPLLITWSVPKHIERKPRPEGELERDWAEFVKRTGFPNRPQEPPPAAPPEPPKPRRRRWPLWLALVIVGLFAMDAYVQTLYKPEGWDVQFSAVPYDTGWIALNDAIDVQLEPGASLSVAHRRLRGLKRVRLEGAARFRVWPIDTVAPMLRSTALLVETRAGIVTAGESDFSVTARADTTVVQVHPLGRRRAVQPSLMTVNATSETGNVQRSVIMGDLDGARLVTGRDPERILPRP